MIKTTLLALALAIAASVATADAQEAKTHHIDIRNFLFDPPRVEVRPGDIVEWTNHDLAPHTATADKGLWDTGWLKAEQSGRFVAAEPGTFAYHCLAHTHMRGMIIVVAPNKE